ncbi:MAG: hypothetical protein JWM47_1695 [Acidimicrobiales bacterium]|nr:hypothetical protein [Acidimicrobiales bacterium]
MAAAVALVVLFMDLTSLSAPPRRSGNLAAPYDRRSDRAGAPAEGVSVQSPEVARRASRWGAGKTGLTGTSGSVHAGLSAAGNLASR